MKGKRRHSYGMKILILEAAYFSAEELSMSADFHTANGLKNPKDERRC